MNLNGYLIKDGAPPDPLSGSYVGNCVGSYEDSPGGESPTCEAGRLCLTLLRVALLLHLLRPGGPARRERHEKAEAPDCSPHPALSAAPPRPFYAHSVNQTLRVKYEATL